MVTPECIRVEGQHGWIQVNGTRFDHDIIIHADGRVTERNCGCSPSLRARLPSSYRNEYFHTPLAEYELGFLQEEKPEVVFIGAGFRGMMPLTPLAKEMLVNFEHYVLPTPRILELVNKENRRFVAILHLSC